MLNISTKGSYGLAALFELACSYEKGCVQIKDIAKAQNIPQQYLEQLLLMLKKAGLVKSTRGVAGGYMLAKHPFQIKIFDILDVLEGGVNLVSAKNGDLVLSNFWKEAQEEIGKIFSKTLQDLVHEKEKMDKHFTYTI